MPLTTSEAPTDPEEIPAKLRGGRGGAVRCRPPQIEDAAAIHRLIASSPPLDVNSLYCYLLIARDHAATSVVAELDSEIVGFISAYRRPAAPDTIFVWQVAVADKARGCGVASRMLDAILSRDSDQPPRYLETTVSPGNAPSRRMFEALASRHDAEITSSPLFSEDLFEGEEHEPEELYRIGPFAWSSGGSRVSS